MAALSSSVFVVSHGESQVSSACSVKAVEITSEVQGAGCPRFVFAWWDVVGDMERASAHAHSSNAMHSHTF